MRESIRVSPLRESELEEAGRIVRLAFGAFLGLPNPLEFMGDRDFVTPRWRARNTVVLAARQNETLIGSNVVTRWGSFGFFGPLTVSPESWNRGVAQRLMSATMKVFSRWGVRQSGLFTFANSPRHVGLYQKFGYWPGPLTALMKYTPPVLPSAVGTGDETPSLLSSLNQPERRQAIEDCAKLASTIAKGLDLSGEIHAVLTHRLGDVLMVHGSRAIRGSRKGQRALDAFAICMNGAGSEGGARSCYVKFAAARGGPGGGERFNRLLHAVDAFASARNAEVETGVSLACEDAFCRMRSHGFRMMTLGVAMHRPPSKTYNRPGVYVLGDWR
jgi:GNAT superfamily N-acetyltransferase